jgi:hypothetical protein
MKKKSIIITLLVVVLLAVVILISYIVTTNSNLGVNQKGDIQKNPLEGSKNEADIYIDKSQYKDINIDSVLATEIFNFVPKYLQTVDNKMSNEYIIYSAISELEEQQAPATKYVIGDGELSGYKSDMVQKTAREIFGTSIEIEKKDKYSLPIGYSSENDLFCIYPMGFDSYEEFQTIKSLKENDKTYILTIYALNVEYDNNDLNNIFISTKDTFKLIKNKETDYDVIRKSMEKCSLSGIELEPETIVNEYKNSLPLIEYELEKLDDRGTKYFVKNIKTIVD